jgi:hypothetical protein
MENGIVIHFEDHIDLIPHDFKVSNTLVIVNASRPKHICSGIIF